MIDARFIRFSFVFLQRQLFIMQREGSPLKFIFDLLFIQRIDVDRSTRQEEKGHCHLDCPAFISVDSKDLIGGRKR